MPSYTLNYFNGRGRAELTRLIFAAAGHQYNDNRITDWPATKSETPLGQLPYLEVDGNKLPQSIAIARFVAREFNLAGPDNLRQAQADSIVDTVIDLVNTYYSKIFPIQDQDEKAKAFNAFLDDQGSKGAANIEKLISLYGSNGFSVGTGLTWADLLIFDLATALFAKRSDILEKYPLINGVYKTVSANQRVTDYVKNRPVTPF